MSTTPTEEQRWSACLKIIQHNVSQQQYAIWFAPLTLDSYDAQRRELTVCVPSPYFREHIEQHFLSLLRQSLVRVYGEGIRLMYKVKVDAKNDLSVSVEGSTRTTASQQPQMRLATAQSTLQPLDSHLQDDLTFDNFVEGAANKLPRTVGMSIAENPHQMTFNPLFVYGASGVGKTHLVTAIGNRLKELHPQARVLYVSAHLFQVQYTESVRQNKTNDFIAFYQTIDVLIIDDIQELATEKTQLAFFHIFNHLHQNGKQLILTSDRPPVALGGMNERLLTRFKWGLLAELERPDQTLRRDILRSKVRHDGLRISEPVIDFISHNVDKSVRDLHGVVTSLMAYSVVYNCEVDIAMAERVIARTVGMAERREITIEGIVEQTCLAFGIEREELLSASRKATIVAGRQVAMYLAQKHTHLSTTKIGAAIGRRNHATVIHSCQSVQQRMETDRVFRQQVEELEAHLR